MTEIFKVNLFFEFEHSFYRQTENDAEQTLSHSDE